MERPKKIGPKQIYVKCLGNLRLQSAWQEKIRQDYEAAEARGRLSDGYKKFLTACYVAAGGDVDYRPEDEGMHKSDNPIIERT